MFNQKSQAGFTLIELLVVVVIIGLLATLILASTQSALIKARDVRRISDLRQIQLALAFYYDKGQNFMGAAGQDAWGDNLTENTLVYELEKSGYIKPVPNDPGLNKYEYWISADKQKYILKAVLEDAGSAALNQDLDGSVLGADCGTWPDDQEGYYCIGN